MSPKDQISTKCGEIRNELAEALASQKMAAERADGFLEAIALLKTEDGSSNLRSKLEDKIKKEKKSADDLVSKLEAKLSAFEDTLKLIEKENSESSNQELRPNSDVWKIREILRGNPKPMNLSEILVILGKEDTPEIKNNVRGSIGRYAREKKIFVQTAPNTYGLVERSDKPLSSIDLDEDAV